MSATGTTVSEVASGTSSPSASSSPVFTFPNNGSNHSTLRIVATIIPIVIIVAIVVWGLLVAAGVMQNRNGRRGLPMPSAPLHLYHEKRAEPQEEPKLWDVKYDVEEAKPFLEDLNPLSVELFSDEASHKRSKSWKGWARSNSQRKWRTFANVPRPGPHSQEGQVTVFVAMPSPRVGTSPRSEDRQLAIGTRPIVYTSTGDEKHPQPTLSSPTTSTRRKKGDAGVRTTVLPVSEGSGVRESATSSAELGWMYEFARYGVFV